jgi:hypothetical protein
VRRFSLKKDRRHHKTNGKFHIERQIRGQNIEKTKTNNNQSEHTQERKDVQYRQYHKLLLS